MIKMITMRQLQQLHRFRGRSALIFLALASTFSVSAFAQNAAKGIDASGYSLIDYGVFAGDQWYQFLQSTNNPPQKLLNGPIFGGRITGNFWNYVSLEEIISVSRNRAAFLPSGNSNYAQIESYSTTVGVLADIHLAPRTAKYRPYGSIGAGYTNYQIHGGLTPPQGPGPFHYPYTIGHSGSPALLYGVGLKVNEAKRIGFRIELMGKFSKAATFDLPASPTSALFASPASGNLYVPNNRKESGIALSLGMDFRTHYVEPAAPPAPPAPAPPPPPPAPPVQVKAITGAHDVCAGDNITLTSGATGGAAGSTISYQWMVNGSPVAGATGASFNLPTAGTSGAKSVTVKATAGDQSATSSAVTVNVMALLPPTITFTVVPGNVQFGDPSIPLNANAKAPNACNGKLTIAYSGEGVTGSNFNPGAVSGFDQTNRLAQQTRSIPLTATATDAHNQTARATANVTVTLKPAASRTDIVFPNHSARVNNAAKRYLLETLTPKLKADPAATVILVGHRDASEKTKADATLGTSRVNNAAAVLSAAKGVCGSLDLSRVQVKDAGADEAPTPAPFGDASVKEKTGQAITAADKRAPYRRVEVWYVPGSAAKLEVNGLSAAPTAAIKKLGCPK